MTCLDRLRRSCPSTQAHITNVTAGYSAECRSRVSIDNAERKGPIANEPTPIITAAAISADARAARREMTRTQTHAEWKERRTCEARERESGDAELRCRRER